MKFAKRLLLLFLLATITMICQAEHIEVPGVFAFADETTPYGWRVHHYDNSNGLSHNTVRCIFEDSQGFMWFGTNNGLNRFDGIEFKQYVYDKKPGSLLSSVINDVVEDDESRLWLATTDGISFYFPHEDVFRPFGEVITATSSITGIVWCLKKGSDGRIWILSQEGVYAYYNKQLSDLTEQIRQCIGVLPEKIFVKDSTAYFGNKDGQIFRSDCSGSHLVHIATLPSAVETINEYNESQLLVGTQHKGLFVINPDTRVVNSLPVTTNNEMNEKELNIYSICQVSDSAYFIGGESGLLVLEGNSIRHLQNTNILLGTLEHDVPLTLLQDSRGNIWSGNHFGGIDCFSPNEFPFHCLNPNEINAQCGRRVGCFAEDAEGRLWIGTEDKGLCCFDPSTGQLTPAITSRGKTLNDFGIMCMATVDNGNKLLIGSSTDGIYAMNTHTRLLSHISKETDIHSLLVDSQGRVWAGIHSGLYLLDAKTGNHKPFILNGNSYFNSLFEDSEGYIWALAINQIYRLCPEDHSVKRFIFDNVHPSSEYYGSALTGFCDSKGRIWLGFEEGGLCLFDKATETLTKVVSYEGTFGRGCYSILEDNDGMLWIGTPYGLTLANPKSLMMTATYTTNHGLPTNQLSYRAGIAMRSGVLVFGTTEGCFSFVPSAIPHDMPCDDIIFTSLLIDDEVISESISYADTLTLDYGQSTFSIAFSTLDYASDGIPYVAYRLKGFDKGWNILCDFNRVHYHNVPPGHYQFQIHTIASPFDKNAENHGGRIATLHIVILPRWYQTIAARLSLLAICILLLLLIVRYIINSIHRKAFAVQMEREKENEEKLYKAKIDFFTHVAHEIRTPTSLIKDPVHRLRMQALPSEVDSTLAMVERNADELNTLVTELLDFQKLESSEVTIILTKEDINRLIRETWNRFALFAKDKNLQVILSLPEVPIFATIDAKATSKILNNLFSNAVKYSSTYIQIRLSEDKEQGVAQLAVSNDGNRIPESMQSKIFDPFVQVDNGTFAVQGSGIGLAFASSLTKLQNGTLIFKGDAKDNEFDLYMPLADSDDSIIGQQDTDFFATHVVENINTPTELQLSGRTCILIVEDSKDMRSYLSSVLRDEYDVLEASDGVYAIEILEKNDVQLVLTDVMMARKDGLELCRDIKLSMDLCHVPVVMLTAMDLLEDHIRGLECGADAYIPKPFSSDYLKAQIRNLLDNRIRLQNKYAHSTDITTDLPVHNKADREFIEKITEEIIAHMADQNYTIEDLSQTLAMSRSTFARKIKAITGQTPGDFICLIRLKKAAEMLSSGNYRVNEVCMLVGFNSTHYFSSIFKKQFGTTPGAYAAATNKQKG